MRGSRLGRILGFLLVSVLGARGMLAQEEKAPAVPHTDPP